MNKELARIITESSSEELSEAQHIIAHVLDERRNKARVNAWNKVVNTIKEYVIAFGGIEVETEDGSVYLTAHDCYTENGRIVIKYED